MCFIDTRRGPMCFIDTSRGPYENKKNAIIIQIIYRLPPLPPTHLVFDESMFGYSLHWFSRSALLVKRSSRTSNLLNGIVKTVGILAKIAWRRRKRKAHRTSACSVIFGRSKRRSRQRASGIGTSGESARIVRRKACVAVSVACI